MTTDDRGRNNIYIAGQCKGVYIAEKMVVEKIIIPCEGKEMGGGWWGVVGVGGVGGVGGVEQIMIGLLNGKIMGPGKVQPGKSYRKNSSLLPCCFKF